MDIPRSHNSDTATKSFSIDPLGSADKENSAPRKAPEYLPSVALATARKQLSKRVTAKRPKPRGFEPWGPHANFLSPPHRPKICKPPARRTVANLASTPPRRSYAEKLKVIFTSPSPTRPPGVAEMSEDVPVVSDGRGDDQDHEGEEARENEINMHLHYKEDTGAAVLEQKESGENRAKFRAEENQDAQASSPLTSESELGRRLGDFVLDSPTKKQKTTAEGLGMRSPNAAPAVHVPSSSTEKRPYAAQSQRSVDAPPPQPTIAATNLPTAPTGSRLIGQEGEESSDAWTDDSKFLPSRADRREKKWQRLQQRQRIQDARNANIERYLSQPDIPRGDMLSPQGMKIAEKAGLMYPSHPLRPGNQAARIQEGGIGNPAARMGAANYPPRPSRFVAVVSKRPTNAAKRRRGQTSAPSEDLLPSNYRSSDADDEDSDPDA